MEKVKNNELLRNGLMAVLFVTAMCFAMMINVANVDAAETQIMPIEVNTNITGNVTVGGEKWYSFKTPKEGFFTVTIEGVKGDDERFADLIYVRVYDSNRFELASMYYSDVDDGKEVTPKINNFPDEELLICVENSTIGVNIDYSIRVDYTEDLNYERERNNDEKSANKLKSDQKIVGLLGENDKDYYAITLENDSIITIEVGPEIITDYAGDVGFELIKSDGKEEVLIPKNGGIDLTAGKRQESKPVEIKAGTFYIKAFHCEMRNYNNPYYIKVNCIKLDTTTAQPTQAPTAQDATVTPQPTKTKTPATTSNNKKEDENEMISKGGIDYVVDSSGNATVDCVNKNKSTIKISSKIVVNGLVYKVVRIGSFAFNGKSKIKKIVIAAKVKVEKNAFYFCKKLKVVQFKKGLTKSAKNAFGELHKKFKVKVPKKYKKYIPKKYR